MKQRNKILSIILAILLVVSLLPITASAADAHTHCVCGGNTDIGDHTTHNAITFTEWTSQNSMPTTAGNYVLMNDVVIDDTWAPVGDTVLCLNGHSLLANNESRRSTVHLAENTIFSLCDCTGGGKISHVSGKLGRGVYAGQANSMFLMYGGNICGNHNSNDSGGGVAGNFKMYGGSINNNKAAFGGGVSVAAEINFTMYGGTIKNNSATYGGGVFVSHSWGYEKATFVMLGGSITDNTATIGGGVCVTDDQRNTANITVGGSAVIKDNTVDSVPSNLYLHYATDENCQQLVTVLDMTDSAKIGITMDSTHEGAFSTDGKDYADKFFSDDEDYVVVADGENLKLIDKSDCPHPSITGVATCTKKATCSACGVEQGDYGEHNIDTNWSFDGEKHWHKCLADGCTVIKDDKAHSGGTATCTKKAECETCGQEYGKVLEHKYEGGKCTLCGAADPNYVTSPQTYDGGNIALVLILLLASGGLFAAAVKKTRKAK